MDLLDSIMNDMDKPPTIKKPVIKDEKKRAEFEKIIKQRQEADNKQRQLLNDFRDKFKIKLHQFINTSVNVEDEKTKKLTSKPLAKIYRTIVHEVCDDNIDEVVAYSFGTEDIDRHCVIWKRGYEPNDDVINAMKAGVEYKPKCKDNDLSDDDGDADRASKSARIPRQPSDKQVAEGSLRVENARKVLPGKQYGFVPVALKEDKRSVEQVIDDQRKLKKQKLLNPDSTPSSSSHSHPKDCQNQPSTVTSSDDKT